MANMTDRNRVQYLLQALFTASTGTVITPGTGGGSALTLHPPYNLRLMSANGSPINTTNGTELAGTGGYTTGGATLGTVFCAAPTAGVMSNSNAVSWTATATWSTINGIEVWDTAGTPLRWLQGAITAISGVVNGDTVQFAISSITVDGSQW
jgi:hypothetical protein